MIIINWTINTFSAILEVIQKTSIQSILPNKSNYLLTDYKSKLKIKKTLDFKLLLWFFYKRSKLSIRAACIACMESKLKITTLMSR